MTAPEELEITDDRSHIAHVKKIETSGKIYYDQTGRFPIKSSWGWNYTMVLHGCDSNVILVDPLKSRAEC